MKVQLTALGCRLNEAELESWTRELAARGHRLCLDGEAADLVVVNTCAVTEEAVRKSRQLLRRLHRDNPEAKLVVSGCYASLDPVGPTQLPGVDLVVPNQDKARLMAILSEHFDLPVMPPSAMESDAHLLLARGRQRAFIKVQDGCRYQCSFCIVTQARGAERSRPVAEIVAEINGYQREGIQEVVLTGVHLGGYGSEGGSDIGVLVRAVLAETDIPRLRLGSLEPWDLPEGFWSLFNSPRLMPHLHLPLQSGSDSVLRRMARRCKTDEYRRLLEAGRAAVPDLNITTDIIVGFPGETDAEWRQTLAFVEACGFGHIHLFSYSPRVGTKAAGLPGQIPESIKRERARELAELAHRLREATLAHHIGRRFPVLIENRVKDCWPGYTPNFLRVEIAAETPEELCNQIRKVEIVGQDGKGGLVGRYSLPSPAGGRGAGGEGATLLERAKTLRSNPTEAEQRLWYHLRAHRFMGLKFKRQKPIGRYIVDFVCFEPRLIIEVDGSQHAEQRTYDYHRDTWLQGQGFTVLRFWNNQVLNETDAVLEAIRQRVSTLSPTPLPPAGEGR